MLLTPLIKMTMKNIGMLVAMELLLFASGSLGQTALLQVLSVGGNLTDVREALSGNPGEINQRSENGLMPLQFVGNNVELARSLIKEGADVNAFSKGGGTMVQEAIASGNVEVAKLLVESGADLTSAGDDGISSLERIAWVKNSSAIPDLLRMIQAKDSRMISERGAKALLRCVDLVNPDFAAELVARGVSPEGTDLMEVKKLLATRIATEKRSDIKHGLLLIKHTVFGDDALFATARRIPLIPEYVISPYKLIDGYIDVKSLRSGDIVECPYSNKEVVVP